jgi:response regulator RpfG family c-di-GMP phosphodiesterase
MPGYSGFELCKTFTSFSATLQTPVFVISGEGGAKTKDYCRELGAAAYFEKPVNFEALRASLAGVLHSRHLERHKEVRVNLQVPLKLTGSDAKGKAFSVSSTTENVSTGGFLCACAAELPVAAIVEVEMVAPEQERVGKAQVVRAEVSASGDPRYEFKFTEMTGEWVLQ